MENQEIDFDGHVKFGKPSKSVKTSKFEKTSMWKQLNLKDWNSGEQ